MKFASAVFCVVLQIVLAIPVLLIVGIWRLMSAHGLADELEDWWLHL